LNAALQVRSKGRAARLAAIGLTPFVDSNHFVCMGLRQSDQRTCVLVAKFSVRLPLTGPTSEQRARPGDCCAAEGSDRRVCPPFPLL
jgi:hypothetical protein